MKRPWQETDTDAVRLEPAADYDRRCANLRADEFYFALDKRDNPTTVVICPSSYYARTGDIWRSRIPIGHLLNDKFKGKGDAFYDYQGPWREAKEFLLKQGFTYKPHMG